MLFVAGCLLTWGGVTSAATNAVVGWRGDGTGQYPQATPPTVWDRRPKGPFPDLRTSTKRPAGETDAGGRALEFCLIPEWLVLGPFAAGDAPLDREFVPDEADLRPDEGEKVGDAAWKPVSGLREGEDFGNVSLDFVRLKEVLKAKGEAAYAHAYLYAPADGRIVLVLDHQGPLKAWFNGKVVYTKAKGSVSLGAVNNISWGFSVYKALPFEVAAQRIPVDLVKGWNRLLVKTTAAFHLRLTVDPATEYEEKNIAWKTKLPDRSNASPIIVGDRIFVCSEPDEVLCLDKKDGHILWRRTQNFFDATPEADREKNPILKEKVPPLREKLMAAETLADKLALRREIAELLLAADRETYGMKVEDHTVSHWPLAGWTTPTPVSDGKFVYVWQTHGVAACYGLDGNRKWIQRVDLLVRDPKSKWGPYRYPCSPLLLGDKLVIGIPGEGMVALNARDGSLAWKNVDEKSCLVANVAAVVAGTPIVFTPNGNAVRVADGVRAWKEPLEGGIGAPRFKAGILYLGRYNWLLARDFTDVKAEPWAPKCGAEEVSGIKSEAGYTEPLFLDGLLYSVASDGILHVIDAQAKKLVYRQKLDLKPIFSYNAAGCTSAPTLAGKLIYAMDNQGNTVIFEPGREFREVARNSLRTCLARDFPLSPQEVTTYANPVFEGSRMYVRGEQYLYCIGQ